MTTNKNSTKSYHDILDTHVTQHAISQFITRSGSRKTNVKIQKKLQNMLLHAREVRKTNPITSLLNNRLREVRYFEKSGWILVVVEGRLTTCYQAKLRHFETMNS